MNRKPAYSHLLSVFSVPYSSIVLLEGRGLGLLIALATAVQPNIAVCGILGLISAETLLGLLGIGKYIHYRKAFLLNSLLVGAYVGDLYSLVHWINSSSLVDSLFSALPTVLLIFLAVGLTFLITSFLATSPSGFPVLSMPFCWVAIALGLSGTQFTGLSSESIYFSTFDLSQYRSLPALVTDGLRSLGTLFCIPDPLFGLFLLALVALRSPMTAAFFILGYTIGATTERLLSFTPGSVGLDSHGYNYSLIFAAVAGCFLIPSRFSIGWATLSTLLGVLVCTSATSLLKIYQVPAMALPFNLILWLVLKTLRGTYPARLSYGPSSTPEAALEQSRNLWLRHRTGEVGIFCPFKGNWTVQQGFDGPWTHKGYWKHALDFVVKDSNQKTHINQGIELSDYFAFGQPILAPAAGVICQVQAKVADNPIGKVENQNNWGNYVIIRSQGGVYISLAHLKQDSIEVAIGATVTVGQKIAECGNSGYSKEPHLHIQVQASDLAGAYTLPFHLLNYQMIGTTHFHRTPQQDEEVSPLNQSVVLDRLLSFGLDETLEWTMTQENSADRKVVFRHSLDAKKGTYFWSDGDSRLYYSKVGTQFYFYGLVGERWSALWDLFAAAPRIPMSYAEAESLKHLEYEDTLPLLMSHSRLRRLLVLSWQLISSRFIAGSAKYQMDLKQMEIKGQVILNGKQNSTFLKIDPLAGFTELRVGNRHYLRNQTQTQSKAHEKK